MKKKTARKLEFFLHFFTVALLLLTGYDELMKGMYYPASIILGLALVTFALLLFWRKLKLKPRQTRVTCYYLEAPAFLLISYLLYQERKGNLSSSFFIAAFIYPMVGFISSKKFRKIRKSA